MSDYRGNFHDWLSRRVFVPASRARRSIVSSQHAAVKALRQGLRFRTRVSQWSEDQKREWILERLRFSARRAYRETAFYRGLFEQIGFDPEADFGFDDFARLPVLDRGDVQRAGRALISSELAANQLKSDSTGGSTGEPTQIWMGPEEQGWRESAGETFQQRLGAPTGSRTAFLWGHHLDPVRAETFRERLYAFQNNLRWFDCFRLSDEVLSGYHREFQSYRPACIVAYAGALASLARHLRERGLSPCYPTGCLVTGAEKLWPEQRELIESVFDKPVHERYGSRDVGYIAYQMEPARSTQFEIDCCNLLVEPETREACSPVLITKLHADGMPMLRYRIGDIARFGEQDRPGHPAFTMGEVLGRETDCLWLPDGRWIHGIQLPHLMKGYPVGSFMLRQRADYSVELTLVPTSNFDERARQSILGTLRSNLPGLSVGIETVDEIPRTRSNKWRPVVSEVDRKQKQIA